MPQRSISSTAVGHSSGSARSRSACSGCSMRARVAWLMRLRVVSLPATTRVTKNRFSSRSSSRSPSISACDQGGHEVVLGVGPPVVGDGVAVAVDLGGGGGAVLGGGLHVGVVEADQHVAEVEHLVPVRLGQADHLADHLQRDLGRHLLDELALAPLAHRVDDGVGPLHDLLLEPGDDAGGEALAHQPAVAVVLGAVHVEDRQAHLGQGLVGLGGDERRRPTSVE